MSMSSFLIRQHQAAMGRIRYAVLTLVCRALDNAGFAHGFSLRGGGVSPLPHRALNFSDRQDTAKNVRENTKRLLMALGVFPQPLVMARQTHSDHRLEIKRGTSLSKKIAGDALFSKRSRVLLGVKTADCVPILLAEQKTGYFAAIHAGWRGTLARIAEKTVHDLTRRGVSPKTIIAAIGPAACGACYEVGGEVAVLFQRAFNRDDRFFIKKKQSRFYLDTAQANRRQLIRAGVLARNIHIAPFCTMHHNHLFFSHRKESAQGSRPVGRQVAVIGKTE